MPGSPPRVWGGFVQRCSQQDTSGFTPTCVGRMLWVVRWIFRPQGSPPRVWGGCRVIRVSPSISKVHPHVCGEDTTGRSAPKSAMGSPPRVWGGSIAEILGAESPGFTPTCVGRIGALQRNQRQREVHPHVCGEDSVRIFRFSFFSGSPPRVWGG